MELSKILSISGKSGLFKMIAQTKNGVIIESLIDKKKTQAFAHNKISSLEEIYIFTDDEELPLKSILKIMFEKHSGGPSIDNKSDNNSLKKYFKEIIPNYDEDRFYVSHMKKIIVWYNLLQKNNILEFPPEEEEKKEEEKTQNKEKIKDESPNKDEK